MRRRCPWSLISFLVFAGHAAHAQCPNGTPKPCALDSNAVVFAPFVVSGPPTLSYLATSVAELFQTAFDGAGRYRGVQTAAATRELRALANPSDMAVAAPVARDLGAGLIVGGSIVSTTGTDVRLSVELYDAVRRKPVVRMSGVRGNVSRLGRMVDSLAFIMSSNNARGGTIEKAKSAAWGTLVDAGKVVPKQTMLLTDFRATAEDSSVAAIAKEAIGISLRQAGFVRVMPPDAVGEALRRMRRQPNERLTLAVARELAQREGIAIVVDGELTRRGNGTELITRVVDVESSATLTLLSTPIGASADLLETMDLFGRRLRSKIGESIQTVQTAPPLTKVTTASTEALLHFDRANRAWFLDDDPARAVEELKRAVTIDTSFAAAWRMIGTAAGSARLSGRSVVLEPQFQNSLNRAFAQRAQATEEERLAIEGTYYTSQDLEKARIAYVALGKLTGDPTINLGFVLNLRRDFAAAESVYRAIYVQPNYPPFAYEDFIVSLMNQGKDHEADSVARLARSRFPNHVLVRLRAGQVFCGRRMFRECELAMDSIIASGATTRPEAIRTKAVSAMYQGQLERSHQLEAEIDGPLTSAGGQSYAAISPGVSDDLRVRRRFDRALAALNGIVDSLRTNELLDAAAAFSEAGAPDRAKSLFSRWEKEAPASARTNANYFRLHIALASIAHAERRYQDAIIEWKNADVKPPDKRASPTAQAMPFGIAAAYDSLQMRDSAIVWYERTLATPNYVIGPNWHPAMRNPGVHERLGQLYEAQGNSAKAIEHFAAFTDLWKDADADLQPRVADARSRLARLRAARP